MSIVGLALAPVTAGASLILTLTGISLGVTSGVNSLVTGVTQSRVNKHHSETASNVFKSFMKDVEQFVERLELLASSKASADQGSDVLEVFKTVAKVCGCSKAIESLVDAASALKVFQSEEAAASAVKLGFQGSKSGRSIPKLASDLPDIGQLAKGK